jgi:hypothetical protein
MSVMVEQKLRLSNVPCGSQGSVDVRLGVLDSPDMSTIAPWLLRLIRVALLVVIFFFLLFTVIALGGPGTGPLEKGVLVVVFLGLLALAVPVHRIGREG